jgi:hypothetical protein
MMTARRVSCVMAFSLGVGGLLRVVVAAAVEIDRGMLPPSAGVENRAARRPRVAITLLRPRTPRRHG